MELGRNYTNSSFFKASRESTLRSSALPAENFNTQGPNSSLSGAGATTKSGFNTSVSFNFT